MNLQCFMLLYKLMIRSHLEYAQTVWSPFRAKLIEEVEKVGYKNALLKFFPDSVSCHTRCRVGPIG